MKKINVESSLEEIINLYNELKSSYKVAKHLKISATAVKRILKNAGVLRTQSGAARDRDNSHLNYDRTDEHRNKLSEIAKNRKGNQNPFFGKTHSKETKNKLSKLAKERTGKRNPNYVDGKYERRPRDFKQAEFTRLRNFIFNQDEYTCSYCGAIGGHLHAHHKIPFWVCKEAFLDIENLTTVCTECHFSRAHLGNWNNFDSSLISDNLLKKYSLDRERLNELGGIPQAIVRPSDINKTEEEDRNVLPLEKTQE